MRRSTNHQEIPQPHAPGLTGGATGRSAHDSAGSARPGPGRPDPAGRHTRAVAQTLSSATEAADRGDYADALSWLAMLEAIGEELPADFHGRREAWRRNLLDRPASRSATDPGAPLGA